MYHIDRRILGPVPPWPSVYASPSRRPFFSSVESVGEAIDYPELPHTHLWIYPRAQISPKRYEPSQTPSVGIRG